MSTGLRLWEISDALQEIGERIAEGGGELTPELEAELDAMEGAFEEKVERIALYIRECEANAIAVAVEEDRLAKLKRHFDAKSVGLKGYLQAYLQRTGRTSLKTSRTRVWMQKNGRPSIRYVGDISALPADYVRIKREVDTQFAYVEHKAGAKLPEGFVVTEGTHLRIG